MDDTTAYMYEIAREFGIEVKTQALHATLHPRVDGYAWPSRGLIVLEQSIIGTWQEKCVLAEENGHCRFPPLIDQVMYHSKGFCGLTSWQQSNYRCLVAKDERGALKWGTRVVIPSRAFLDYLDSGPHFLWEWCDHFAVEPWFMSLRIGYMLEAHRGRFRRRDAIRPGLRSSTYNPPDGGFRVL